MTRSVTRGVVYSPGRRWRVRLGERKAVYYVAGRNSRAQEQRRALQIATEDGRVWIRTQFEMRAATAELMREERRS